MKILHTADWHLGKKLDRFSRLEEQTNVLEEIIQIADKQNVDLVLIAGDLFDSFNPSIEATELFYKTIKRLTNNGKRPVIAIAGNHDAPDRIDAPDPLARECGIILIGYPNAEIQKLDLEHFQISKTDKGFIELIINGIDFPVRILHTPYANEVRLKEYFGENEDIKLNISLKNKWSALADEYCDEKGANLLITHLYMNSQNADFLEEPDGERPLKIGNTDLVFFNCIPPQIQYTALGHLHSFNNIGTVEKPAIYSSSILCYSFAEAGQTKYVSIVEAVPNKAVGYTKIPLTKGKILERKTFDNVSDAVDWLTKNPDALVELTMESETFLTTAERKMIFQAHNGIVTLIPKVKYVENDNVMINKNNLDNKDIEALFVDYFKLKNNNQVPNKEIIDLFREIKNS